MIEIKMSQDKVCKHSVRYAGKVDDISLCFYIPNDILTTIKKDGTPESLKVSISNNK